MKCPVCTNELSNKFKCGICGYDSSSDFVRNRTLYPALEKDFQVFRQRVLEYNAREKEKKLAETRALMEILRKEQERKIANDTISEAEKKRIEKEYGHKKVHKSLRIASVMILFIFLATIILSLKNDKFDLSSINDGWSEIRDRSIDALECYTNGYGWIDYSEDSLEEISEMFKDNGYYVEVITEEGCTDVQGTFENSDFFAVVSDDTFEEMTPWRGLYFWDWSDELDASSEKIYSDILPLPYDISFGDSFETVFTKLGITEKMIESAQEENELYIVINPPENVNNDDVRIYMQFDDFSFCYQFSSDTLILNNYYVAIYDL